MQMLPSYRHSERPLRLAAFIRRQMRNVSLFCYKVPTTNTKWRDGGENPMNREIRFLFIPMVMLLLLALASVDLAFAQATSASLGGVVQDQTKELIPGVTVTAKNVGT